MRSLRLAQRVKAIEKAASSLFDVSNTAKDNRLKNYIILLKTCLEDVDVELKRYIEKNRLLAIRVEKVGTDEEEFVKLSERLENCVLELQLKIDNVFSRDDDLEDFEADVLDLDEKTEEILKCHSISLGNAQTISEKIVKQISDKRKEELKALIAQQIESRKSYYSVRPLGSDIYIQPEGLSFEKIVGKGESGIVWKGAFKNADVAIKKLSYQLQSEASVQTYRIEANMMRSINHSRTLNCVGISKAEGVHLMVTEYMPNGCLLNYITSKRGPWAAEWVRRKDIALDIALGMNYLHRLRIIHKDLTSTNVLLDQNLRAKISDFGLSVTRSGSQTTAKLEDIGTTQYMAPECFGISPVFSAKSDVFAFAMVTWEISHWRQAYEGIDRFDVKDSIVKKKDRLTIGPLIPRAVASLIMTCWDQNPNARPGFPTIIDFLEVLDLESEIVQDEDACQDSEEDLKSPRVPPTPAVIVALSSPAASPASQLPPIPSNKGMVEVTNTALSSWWMKISHENTTVVTWDMLNKAIIEYLGLRNPADLDSERLRKKIDFKTNLQNPTLSRLYQIIQEKPPHEFFVRFLNTEPDSMNAGPPVPPKNKNAMQKKGSLMTLPLQKNDTPGTPPLQKKQSLSSIPIAMLNNDSLISIPIPQKKESTVSNPMLAGVKKESTLSNPNIMKKPEPLHVTINQQEGNLPIILSAQTSPAEETRHDPLQLADTTKDLHKVEPSAPSPRPQKQESRKHIEMEKTPAKKGGSCCIIL